MIARESKKTAGFILKSLHYGESDLIVTFYSNDFGKINGIAKGAKRSKKRFANSFEPFSLANVIFTSRIHSTLVFINACDVIEHYRGIRENLEKTLIASYFIDLADQFSPEGKKNESAFELLRDFLQLLNTEKASDAVVRFFELRFLAVCGFEPTLDHCISCKTQVLNGNNYYFHPASGGIQCVNCVRPDGNNQTISAGTVRSLLLGRNMDTNKIRLFSMPERMANEASNMFCVFISHILGHDVQSRQVMEQVRRYCP